MTKMILALGAFVLCAPEAVCSAFVPQARQPGHRPPASWCFYTRPITQQDYRRLASGSGYAGVRLSHREGDYVASSLTTTEYPGSGRFWVGGFDQHTDPRAVELHTYVDYESGLKHSVLVDSDAENGESLPALFAIRPRIDKDGFAVPLPLSMKHKRTPIQGVPGPARETVLRELPLKRIRVLGGGISINLSGPGEVNGQPVLYADIRVASGAPMCIKSRNLTISLMGRPLSGPSGPGAKSRIHAFSIKKH